MNNELYHFGVKGMRWGKRKAPENDIKQRKKQAMKDAKAKYKQVNREYDSVLNRLVYIEDRMNNRERYGTTTTDFMDYAEERPGLKKQADKMNVEWNNARYKYKQTKKEYRNLPEVKAKRKKIAIGIGIGASIVGATLAVYGGKKFHDAIRDKKKIELGRKIKEDLESQIKDELGDRINNPRFEQYFNQNIRPKVMSKNYTPSAKTQQFVSDLRNKRTETKNTIAKSTQKFYDSIKNKDRNRLVKIGNSTLTYNEWDKFLRDIKKY